MKRTERSWLRHILLAIVAGLVTLMPGCAVIKALESEPGTDLTAVKAGATRQQVESVLGRPRREWATSCGVQYRLYRYYAGIDPDPDKLTGIIFNDIVSLGLAEAFIQIEEAATMKTPFLLEKKRKFLLMAVAYDSQNVVLGVFPDIDEFTPLPEDGRPIATSEASVPRGQP
jgi:hypothetical protein